MLNNKTDTDYDITKLILEKFTEYNLEDVLIYSDEQPFLEEVKSIVKKNFIVKNEIKNWYSENHQPIRDSVNRSLSNLILEKLDTIKINNIKFLKQQILKQQDLEKHISLFSNLFTLHFYAFKWLRYLAIKYHNVQDEDNVDLDWECEMN